VLNHIYSRKGETGGIEYFWPDEVENVYDAKGAITGAKLRKDGSAVEYGGVGTMSKSKNNGVDPQSLIDTQGADTARLFVMFASPPEQTLEWSGAGVDGSHRFLRRLWAFCYGNRERIAAALAARPVGDWSSAGNEVKALRRDVHALLKQADYDYQRIQYNTVVSACMKLLNTLDDAKVSGAYGDAALAEGLRLLLSVLYPIVPHLTWNIWQQLGFAAVHGDLLDAAWPEVDEAAMITDEIELMLQVNGKLRGSLSVPSSADKPAIEALAVAHEAVGKFLEGRDPKRVIVVPGKLVNVVG